MQNVTDDQASILNASIMQPVSRLSELPSDVIHTPSEVKIEAGLMSDIHLYLSEY